LIFEYVTRKQTGCPPFIIIRVRGGRLLSQRFTRGARITQLRDSRIDYDIHKDDSRASIDEKRGLVPKEVAAPRETYKSTGTVREIDLRR